MKILQALKAKFQTRDIPKTARGRFNALMRKEKGNTARVAERLGVSRRQVQRLAKGERKIENSKAETLARLEKEVTRDHQPRVTAKAQKEAQQRGMVIETRASVGFTADGDTTDDARMRRLTEAVPSKLIPEVFEALRNGDEKRLHELASQTVAQYFRLPGTHTAEDELDIELNDIDYIEWDFRG
ncbi:helix-turn-helix transcriptional regulator [Streptomyces sp. H10-C2]|uniref:telomere-protecting terminal protein Tpg n=1 Tax=unclassified Streptomyces TaxID=2593676 RepID=UPI0024BAF858|nr:MULTISPECIES: helix-turn-helix transcriptional regulator [unclassified Streptomyces]MDJ0345525.1 helix-turn-helix transcriptional regulator [Streptomyces sp. PH10-H1]MDJ0374471.1 helix-turn-helix transcriptional regulator [Streptomyces sp. H10-C2]